MSHYLNRISLITISCLWMLSLCVLSIVSAQTQQGSSTSPATSDQSTPRPKKKVLKGSRGFEQYAGRDASDKLITGAATRSGLTSAAAYYNQGLKNYETGQLKEAANAFLMALRLVPDWADVHYSLGIVYSELGQYREAVDEFKKVSGPRASKDLRTLAAYNMGNAYFDLEQYEDALAAYKQVIADKPEFPQPHYNSGLSYIGLGETEKAVQEFQTAIQLKPEWAEAQYNLGVAYLQLGKKSQALEQQQILKRLKSELADKLATELSK